LHAAEQRACATNAPLPSTAHSGRATGQATATTFQGCWAKPRSTSCHVVAAFEQPLMSNSRLSKQAGRSELCHGQACRAGAVEEAYRGKRAAGEPSDAPSGPACSRTMGPRNPRTPAANSVSQSCDGASSRRRCRAPRLRLRPQLRFEGGVSCGAKTKAGVLSAPVAGIGVLIGA
jgi:hypothetical protein